MLYRKSVIEKNAIMNRIETYEQCNFIIQNFKKDTKKIITNFFFLPKELKQIIATREIRYQESKDTLIICVEEIDFSHIYFFKLDESVPVIEDTGKVMIVDFVVRSGINLEKIELEKKKWFAANFKEYKQYIRLKYILEKPSCSHLDFLKTNSWCLSHANTNNTNDILDIWMENLDKYSTPLPSTEELVQLIESGYIYIISDNNIVVGAVYMNMASKVCILKHLTVCASYRRQGLGTALMDYALGEMKRKGIEKCFLWVDVNNIPAYESYKKYGFIEEGLWSIQLIKFPGEK